MNFEYLDVKSRAYMLQAAVSLFADWPDYLIETLRSTNPLHHLLMFKDLPSWYGQAERFATTAARAPALAWTACRLRGKPNRRESSR